jgi:ferritin-like metal-binding protein YciE
MESIRELLIEEMRDLYDAEKQLVKALPKMAKASTDEDLKQCFEKHLEETKGQVSRLEQAFELLGEKAKSKPCAAMKGLIEEAQETMQEVDEGPLLDSAMICAAQKVEHYEIAGYGTLSAWAKALDLDEVGELLEETLEEEKAADEALTEANETILVEAASAAGMDEEAEDNEMEASTSSRKGASMAGGKSSKQTRSSHG